MKKKKINIKFMGSFEIYYSLRIVAGAIAIALPLFSPGREIWKINVRPGGDTIVKSFPANKDGPTKKSNGRGSKRER